MVRFAGCGAVSVLVVFVSRGVKSVFFSVLGASVEAPLNTGWSGTG